MVGTSGLVDVRVSFRRRPPLVKMETHSLEERAVGVCDPSVAARLGLRGDSVPWLFRDEKLAGLVPSA